MVRKVRFRLWFHKLKRFSHTSHPIKRRSLLSSSPHALDFLGFSASTSAPPLQALHSSSSPDHISVSLLSSPCHSLPVTFSSPRHSMPATFSSPRHSLPSTSLPRHGRKVFKPSKHQAINFSSAVLLSPINSKALDIPYPSGDSSPAYTFMQSPTLQALVATSPAVKIFSPPIRKPHTVLFKSPLHPLAYQNSDNPSNIDPEMISTPQGRDANISARASRKAEISVNSCRSHADCFVRQSQAEEESNLITATHRITAQQRRSTRPNSHVKRSPLIVDCGCHPSFSSSFRKTKKTLQACGSCSGNKPGIIPIHNKDATQKHDMLCNVKSSISGGESKKSIDCCGEITCPVSAKEDHKKLQLKKRRKRMDVAEMTAPKNPKSLFKQQEFGPTTPLMNETFDENNRETKTKKGIENADCNPADSNSASNFSTSFTRDAALLMDARTLAWEKDFSSFTSEDTFFSSFERSRPSFSSNSSSECFDKKLSYSKPASNHSNVVLHDASAVVNRACSSIKRSTDDLNCSNPASNSCLSKDAAKVGISPVNSSHVSSALDGHSLNKLQHTLRSMSCKGHDPLVEVSFHGFDVRREDAEVAPRGDAHVCAEAASEHRVRTNTYHGMKRSSLNPLVEIKEDPCEGGSTDTVELDKTRSSRKSRSSVKEEKLSLNSDYTSSCHSDYYANAPASLQRSSRVRKKSHVYRNKGRDTGSARSRRRAQLQARWRLSDEQIQWQSSVEDEDVDHDVRCKTLNLNEQGYMHTENKFNMPRRRRTRDIKHKNSALINVSIDAPKPASSPLQNSANSQVVDDSAPGGAAQVMRNISDNTSTSRCEAERVGKTEGESPNVNKQSGYANNPRLSDSVAVVKCSKDPLVDFRESMVDMIIERQIYSAADLGELLQCFLSLNSREHHDVIVQAFGQVWGKLFQES